MNDQEKVNYIVGQAIMRAEINAFKNILTMEQKQQFDETIRLYRDQFASGHKGLSPSEAFVRSSDFNAVLFFKLDSER